MQSLQPRCEFIPTSVLLWDKSCANPSAPRVADPTRLNFQSSSEGWGVVISPQSDTRIVMSCKQPVLYFIGDLPAV